MGGVLFGACSSRPPSTQTGLWTSLKRGMMVVRYAASNKGPAVSEAPAPGKKSLEPIAPKEETPETQDKEESLEAEAPADPQTATEEESTDTAKNLILPPWEGPPPNSWLAGLVRNSGAGAPANAPGKPSVATGPAEGKVPSYLPSPSLAGSPKIQVPGTAANATGTPTTTAANTATSPAPNNGATPPPPAQPPGLDQLAPPPADTPNLRVAALEGTLGSTIESAVLPSFDALYFTLPGQDVEYDKNAIRDLDFNIWAMSGPAQVYDNMVTARFYTERTYLPEPDKPETQAPSPTPEGCTREDFTLNGNAYVKMICKGPFGFINGHLLRVIACGTPNQTILASYPGDSPQKKLAAFLAQAWNQGDQSIWDQELCPERRYLDYPFVGAEAHLTGVLESGKIYFIAQFPVDYMDHQSDYGPPLPIVPGMTVEDLGTYATSRSMNNFLYNGRIVQVVMGNYDPAHPGAASGEYTNIALGELIQATAAVAEASESIPPNEFCQGVATWDESRVQLENALVEEINRARSQEANCGIQGNFAATRPLSANGTLRCAARVHSRDMNDGNFFSHINPTNHSSELNRIFTAGTQPPLAGTPGMENQSIAGTLFANGGENIAKGPAEAAQVVQEWLASPGHCANMMNPAFTHLGAGYHPGSNTTGPLWTLTLGTPWK